MFEKVSVYKEDTPIETRSDRQEDYGCYNSKGSQVGQYRRGLHPVLRLEKVNNNLGLNCTKFNLKFVLIFNLFSILTQGLSPHVSMRIGSLLDDQVVPRSTSFLKIKRMSAKVIKPTSQGGWELYRKRAY